MRRDNRCGPHELNIRYVNQRSFVRSKVLLSASPLMAGKFLATMTGIDRQLPLKSTRSSFAQSPVRFTQVPLVAIHSAAVVSASEVHGYDFVVVTGHGLSESPELLFKLMVRP